MESKASKQIQGKIAKDEYIYKYLPPSPASVKLLKGKQNEKSFQTIQFAKRSGQIRKAGKRIQGIRAMLCSN